LLYRYRLSPETFSYALVFQNTVLAFTWVDGENGVNQIRGLCSI